MSGGGAPSRRPVAARRSAWAVALAGWLARRRVRPNAISALSLVAAAVAGGGLLLAGRVSLGWSMALLLFAAGLIEIRLLCNLLDGMVAIEGGLGTGRGPVFNELPDRLSDAVILVCAGYVSGSPVWSQALGWCAALLAVLTAYVRTLAGSLGATQDFGGPMAKQVRMHVMSLACLSGALLSLWNHTGWAMLAGLAIVIVGSALTVVRRTAHLIHEIDSAC